MAIEKLPKHIVNKLKAGEIVERPSSIVKELLENALDAGAENITLEIKEGGKKLIKVEDDGVGIEYKDLDLVLDRYATSKIKTEEDLDNIISYGFRGEALSSIAEVSNFMIQTKTQDSSIGYELKNSESGISINQIPFHKDHGTIVYVEDIFYNIPARNKFLKTEQTERNYIRNIFLDFALVNYDKNLFLKKDGKNTFSLAAKDNIMDRVFDIYKKDWEKNLKILENKDKQSHLYGVVSDAALTFGSQENIKIFVNKRPVQDKVLKKAIMEAYQRQIAPGEYPLSVIFLDVDPLLVDVNVHPRKMEVKFLDPGSMFNFIKNSIQQTLGADKFSGGSVSSGFYQNNFSQKNRYGGFNGPSFGSSGWGGLDLDFNKNITSSSSFQGQEDNQSFVETNEYNFRVLGQIWDSYIIIESEENLYFVDQHALAERITFEKMKRAMKQDGVSPEIILNPMTIEVSKNVDLESKIEQLNEMGFDISMFGENKIVVYAIPSIFSKYRVDVQKLLDKIIYMDEINYDIVLDEIFATRACKTSIKAGESLSMEEMKSLIKDAFDNIEGLFVCQHGRPSFVKFSKHDIEGLFDR